MRWINFRPTVYVLAHFSFWTQIANSRIPPSSVNNTNIQKPDTAESSQSTLNTRFVQNVPFCEDNTYQAKYPSRHIRLNTSDRISFISPCPPNRGSIEIVPLNHSRYIHENVPAGRVRWHQDFVDERILAISFCYRQEQGVKKRDERKLEKGERDPLK